MENIAPIGIALGKTLPTFIAKSFSEGLSFEKKGTRLKLIGFLATCSVTTITMEARGGFYFMVRKLAELWHFPKRILPTERLAEAV